MDTTYYNEALAAVNAGRPLPEISADHPQAGLYFKKASRAGGRVPVRIQLDGNGELVAIVGVEAEHALQDPQSIWTWVAGNPTDKESYTYAWKNGKWPEGTPTTAVDGPAAHDDNLPADPYERLLTEVQDKMDQAQRLIKSLEKTTPEKTHGDMARNIQAFLLRRKSEADTMHKVEKQPHLDAGRAVDDKFRFRDAIASIARQLGTIVSNVAAREEARLRAEAQRKFEEERARAEAERKRLEAERAAKLEADPIAALTDPEPELPEIPTGPEEVKVRIGGGVGRAAGLRTEYVPVIEDYQACLAHFADHEDVHAVVEKLVKAATRVGKSKTNIPGVKVTERRRAA